MSESVTSEYGEDLAQTLAIITQLKSENVELKRNFENLKSLHLQLNEGHKSLQGRYGALYEERNNVEKQYQSLCESWRVELEEKQRHLEAVKAQVLGPRDLDVLRVKLMEEVEAPFRSKCDNLAKEAESSHQAYTKLRREYEELQNTYRSLEVRTVGEQEAHRLEHTALARELRDKAAHLTAAHGGGERGGVAISVAAGCTGYLLSKAAASDTAIRSLQRDLEAARYSVGQVKQELDETAQTQLQAQLDSAVRMAGAEKTALLAEAEEGTRRLEERLAAAQAEAAKRDSALTGLKLVHQEELGKLSTSWEQRLTEERRAASERVRELLDEKADANERAAAVQRAAEERRREDEAALRQAQSEADSAARDAASEAQRAEGLAKQLADSAASAEALRRELGDAKSELVKLQMTAQQLAERRNELEHRIKSAEEAGVQIRAARDGLAAELEAVRREAEEDKTAALRAADSSRAAWAMEKAALGKRYQAAIKELGVRHEAELRKSKRKSRGAHAAVVQLTDEVADLKFKAAEAKHVNHMSEVLFLGSPGNTGRTSSPPYRDQAPYSPGGTPGGGYFGGGGGYGSYSTGRPITAPSYLQAGPSPNVVIVTGNGAGADRVAAAAAAGAAAGAAAQHQQQQGEGTADSGGGGDGGGGGGGGALIDSAILSSIAALRQRQQQYINAARLGVQP
ncbi:Coiled-coil domain-containing protein 41 [Tetrabaena socialis]|uniref:Coiled-coil domain-containing protein 41 n=1 Tax=Tetrabaena socialis TaxID=47790 RepID=A0A2J8AEM1_9CHLO|nr:Coiled-coil domain-containing protein 41 [Tetrabaena socialis]|eukprot:PNH10970.1 Coiled-coil domain-containing protein 41 [Tetrabaena socialis]